MHHSRLKLSISFYLVHSWSALTSFAFLSDEKMMTNWRRMGEGPLRWLGSHDIMKSLREEHLFSLSLSSLRRDSNAIFSYLMGDWKKDMTKLFWEVLSCNRLRYGKENSGWVAIKKKFFARSVQHQNMCPDRWWNSHPWKYSKLSRTQPWATYIKYR